MDRRSIRTAQEISIEERRNESDINSLQELFHKHGTLREFKKDSFLFMKGDKPDYAYLLESGILKIGQLTDEGKDVTFFLRKAGDVFALAEIILSQRHFCYAQCLRDCKIRMIEADIIKERLEKDLNVTRDILYLMTSRLMYQQRTVELLNTQSVSQRLAWFLKNANLNLKNNLDLTHEEISNVIGCRRQTVTRILNRWRKEGRIKYNRNKIIIINLNDISLK